MPKQPLSVSFVAREYKLNLGNYPLIEMVIKGKKIGRPSKRITLNQNGLSVSSAKITGTRKNITYGYDVRRINRINSSQEVRLHTAELLYPGEYELKLVFKSRQPIDVYQNIGKEDSWRAYFPSVDEIPARGEAEFKLI